jgi:RNA polymerase sigma-70 factor, ECF subfamily
MQDVLQDTMLAMVRGVHDFRGASSVSTWLYAIARSFCIKKRRRGKLAPLQAHTLELSETAAHQLADPARGPDEQVASKAAAGRYDRTWRCFG